MTATHVRIIGGSRGQTAAIHALLRRHGYQGPIVRARDDYPHPQAATPDDQDTAA